MEKPNSIRISKLRQRHIPKSHFVRQHFLEEVDVVVRRSQPGQGRDVISKGWRGPVFDEAGKRRRPRRLGERPSFQVDPLKRPQRRYRRLKGHSVQSRQQTRVCLSGRKLWLVKRQPASAGLLVEPIEFFGDTDAPLRENALRVTRSPSEQAALEAEQVCNVQRVLDEPAVEGLLRDRLATDRNRKGMLNRSFPRFLKHEKETNAPAPVGGANPGASRQIGGTTTPVAAGAGAVGTQSPNLTRPVIAPGADAPHDVV